MSRRHSDHHQSVPGTATQLMRTHGRRGNEANFKHILPSKMKELVQQGLFEPWQGTYRITAKGRQLLARLEAK